jgi:hypothetical protein
MKTVEYLNEAKRCLGIESDYALAKALQITRSSISLLMNGKTTLADETAIKVAKIIGKPPGLVVAASHAEREKNPEVKAVWDSLMEKISKGFETLLSNVGPCGARLSACR